MQVEHFRHRCFDNFIVNILSTQTAYWCFRKSHAPICKGLWIQNSPYFEFIKLTLI